MGTSKNGEFLEVPYMFTLLFHKGTPVQGLHR